MRRGMSKKRRVCIIGLDCLTPELVFGARLDGLPSLAKLVRQSLSGRLESSIPPITVPAWSAMLTGLDPGVLGCYGFHDRADRSYTNRRLASSLDIREPRLWDHLGTAGLFSRLITVPQTYPPQPILGEAVSDYPAGLTSHPKTYPAHLAAEALRLAGGDLAETPHHRDLTKGSLRAAIRANTERRFRLARAWAQKKDWQLLMLVDMGPDRMHHAFWADMQGQGAEPEHQSAIYDYYRLLDAEVGQLIATLDDEDIVLVVSDHGAKTMKGGIAINQWLRDAGYLALEREPRAPTPFAALEVDFGKTRAFADGGYIGRVHLNIRGREPAGMVDPREADALLAELTSRLENLKGPEGEALATRVFRPCEIYREVRGVAPDLIVCFDDLGMRALGSVGHPSLCVTSNDGGRDHANHAHHGVIILRDGRGARQAPPDASLYDILPTLLERLELPVPANARGRVLY